MKDFLGNEIKVGDNVIFIKKYGKGLQVNHSFAQGIVKDFTTAFVVVKTENGIKKRMPEKLVVVKFRELY